MGRKLLTLEPSLTYGSGQNRGFGLVVNKNSELFPTKFYISLPYWKIRLVDSNGISFSMNSFIYSFNKYCRTGTFYALKKQENKV
jgi:hypothetical protein